MTTSQAKQATLDRIADTRYHVAQAALEGATARGEIKLTIQERLYRLSSRYHAHKAAGRVQAAQAVKRMAQRLVEGGAE